MKDLLIKICWPILRFFETDVAATNYKPSHRIILIVVGIMFGALGIGSAAFAFSSGIMGGLIPFIVFVAIGLVSIIVGALGSDNAISKMWGTK